MQQDGLFVRDKLAYQLRFLHLLHQCVREGVEVGPVVGLEELVHPRLLELLVRDGSVAYWHAAVALPPVVRLQSFLSGQVFDPVALQVQLDEIALEVDGDGSVCLPLRQVLQKDVGDEVDASTQRAVVIIEPFRGNRVVLQCKFLELSYDSRTFLRRLMVSSSTTLASPLGLWRRLEIAIFSPCFLELLRISQISSSILLYANYNQNAHHWKVKGSGMLVWRSLLGLGQKEIEAGLRSLIGCEGRFAWERGQSFSPENVMETGMRNLPVGCGLSMDGLSTDGLSIEGYSFLLSYGALCCGFCTSFYFFRVQQYFEIDSFCYPLLESTLAYFSSLTSVIFLLAVKTCVFFFLFSIFRLCSYCSTSSVTYYRFSIFYQVSSPGNPVHSTRYSMQPDLVRLLLILSTVQWQSPMISPAAASLGICFSLLLLVFWRLGSISIYLQLKQSSLKVLSIYSCCKWSYQSKGNPQCSEVVYWQNLQRSNVSWRAQSLFIHSIAF